MVVNEQLKGWQEKLEAAREGLIRRQQGGPLAPMASEVVMNAALPGETLEMAE
ncbi:MAG TPA: hypothetical protein VNN73_23500 [Blastocatellia bacterium]|nr:hypothetical protein [Blastocatellia bacterium]